jgi:hypothetical protein
MAPGYAGMAQVEFTEGRLTRDPGQMQRKDEQTTNGSWQGIKSRKDSVD